jgi:hypothetical protein
MVTFFNRQEGSIALISDTIFQENSSTMIEEYYSEFMQMATRIECTPDIIRTIYDAVESASKKLRGRLTKIIHFQHFFLNILFRNILVMQEIYITTDD